MKLSYRIILGLFLAFIIWIFYWALFSPKENISVHIYKTLKQQEQRADLAFKEVSFEEIDAGIKYWQLFANTAMMNKSNQLATLKESNGTFFSNGQPALLFQSPVALWDMKKKEIYLDQPIGYDVSLKEKITALTKNLKNSQRQSVFNLRDKKNGKALWFVANNLSWKLADKKIVCTGDIVIKKSRVIGYAEKLNGDVSLEEIKVSGNPRVIINPKNNSPITMEANYFEIDSPAETITAKGNSKIFWQEAIITCREVKYFENSNKLDLSGEVKIAYQDIRAQGDSAIYNINKDKIVLTGKTRAKQKENRLRGEKIMVSLKENKISVFGQGKFIISEEELK